MKCFKVKRSGIVMERFKLLSIFLETIKFSKKNLPNYFYYYILICVLYAFINFFSIDAMRNVIDSITLNLNNNEFYSLFLILIILKILCDFFSDYIRYHVEKQDSLEYQFDDDLKGKNLNCEFLDGTVSKGKILIHKKNNR